MVSDCPLGNLWLEWTRSSGWTVLAAPPDYQGDGDDNKLESHVINDNLVELIAETEQSLESVNFQMMRKEDDGAKK